MTMADSIKALASAAVLVFAAQILCAQEIVHAIAGSIASVNPANGSFTLQLPDNSYSSFNFKPNPSTRISLAKTLREGPGTVSVLPKQATHVIVYYYGLAPMIAISVKDLGEDVESISGAITSADKAARSITVQPDSGGADTCRFVTATTIETSLGAVDAAKYSPRRGERVNMVCSSQAGTEVAQFIQRLND
jgi:hypothetical protein